MLLKELLKVATEPPRGSPRGEVLLIIPYFGKLGRWFPLYLQSLSQQSTIDLLLITDAQPEDLPANVHLLRMDFAAFRARTRQELGIPVALPTTRHLCDLKPAYGRLFEEFLRGYDYWAFGDEDVLYGDLDRLLRPLLERGFDVLTPSREMTLGHLTILRNTPRIIGLAFEDPGYRSILTSGEFVAYDGSGWAKGGRLGSFTETVRAAEGAGDISVLWGFPKRGDIPWPGAALRYDGKSICETSNSNPYGAELVYFHWGRAKRQRYLKFPSPEQARRGFTYDRFGFYNPRLFHGYEFMRHKLRFLHRCAATLLRRPSTRKYR